MSPILFGNPKASSLFQLGDPGACPFEGRDSKGGIDCGCKTGSGSGSVAFLSPVCVPGCNLLKKRAVPCEEEAGGSAAVVMGGCLDFLGEVTAVDEGFLFNGDTGGGIRGRPG